MKANRAEVENGKKEIKENRLYKVSKETWIYNKNNGDILKAIKQKALFAW